MELSLRDSINILQLTANLAKNNNSDSQNETLDKVKKHAFKKLCALYVENRSRFNRNYDKLPSCFYSEFSSYFDTYFSLKKFV